MIQSLKKKSHSEIPLQPRMLKSERTVSQRWQECGTTGILIYCGGGGDGKWCSRFGKLVDRTH